MPGYNHEFLLILHKRVYIHFVCNINSLRGITKNMIFQVQDTIHDNVTAIGVGGVVYSYSIANHAFAAVYIGRHCVHNGNGLC